jgi:hypothetical protein
LKLTELQLKMLLDDQELKQNLLHQELQLKKQLEDLELKPRLLPKML